MQRAVFTSAWRNTFRCAREVAFGLFLHWRADPIALAVVEPILYIRSAVRRGLCSWDRMAFRWALSTDTRAGPIAAAKQALQLAGVDGGLFAAVGVRGDGWDLTVGTDAAARNFLLNAYSAHRFSQLASRRPSFAGCADGVEVWASTKFERSPDWTELRRATLRTIMAGGGCHPESRDEVVPRTPSVPALPGMC